MAQKWENFPSFLKRKSVQYKLWRFLSTRGLRFQYQSLHPCARKNLMHVRGLLQYPGPTEDTDDALSSPPPGTAQQSRPWASTSKCVVSGVLIKDFSFGTSGLCNLSLFRTHGFKRYLTHSLGSHLHFGKEVCPLRFQRPILWEGHGLPYHP